MKKNMCRLAASSAVVAVFALGCSNYGDPSESVAEVAQGLDVCSETLPANRFVDGLPAYSQCAATTNSAIWSNNGIDTATSSQGTGWVRTQGSGGYQCTELAWRYMHFKWNVDYRGGNAGEWCDGTLPPTLVKSTVPVHGDLMVFAAGVCGAGTPTGHVAVIDTVDMAGGNVTIVEQNQAGRRTAKQSCATCFLHAVANNGSTNPGSGGSGGASTAMGGASTSSGGASSTGGSSSKGGARSSGGASANAGASASGGRVGAGGASSAGFGGGESFGGASSAGGSTASSGAPGSGGLSAAGGLPAAGGSSGGAPFGSGGALSSGGTVTSSSNGGAPGAAGTSSTSGAAGAASIAGSSSAGGPVPIDPEVEGPGCSIGARGPTPTPKSAAASWSWLLLGLLLRRRTPRATR